MLTIFDIFQRLSMHYDSYILQTVSNRVNKLDFDAGVQRISLIVCILLMYDVCIMYCFLRCKNETKMRRNEAKASNKGKKKASFRVSLKTTYNIFLNAIGR